MKDVEVPKNIKSTFICQFCDPFKKKLKSYKLTPKPMLQTPMPIAPEAQVVEPDETPEEPRYTPMPKKQFKNMPKMRALSNDDEQNSVSIGILFNSNMIIPAAVG